MGTDIYLKWDKQSEEEKMKQSTGFDIFSGNVGYLRASLGMTNENAFLRFIFPEHIWKSKNGGEIFDFKDKKLAKKVAIGGFGYLYASFKGIEFQPSEKDKLVIEKVKSVFGGGDIKLKMGGSLTFFEAVGWLNSVIKFMELGVEKQTEGLNPKVIISW